MQQGGGIGYDFSTLRPRGTRARSAGTTASGAVSFMHVWDAMCGTILSTGARRGAMMATLRCDYPDIEEFVAAKQASGRLRRFNLSVQITDALITAVHRGNEWPLIVPAAGLDGDDETVMHEWPGEAAAVSCRVMRRMRARNLWDHIMRATYDYAEPGVLFVDRINRLNNLWYSERISAINPCGGIPLPAYGACDLGSLILTHFVRAAFTPQAELDDDALAETTRIAVRLLDNDIDASHFPLPQQAESARGSRRIGFGITGLADALVMLGMAYGSDRWLAAAADAIRVICHTAYRASVALAEEKGSFAYFERNKHLDGPFIRDLPDDIRMGIARHGIRNSHLLAIAPTGTIGLLAANVSSGLEPIFAGSYSRRLLDQDGRPQEFIVTDYALDLWRQKTKAKDGVPGGFITAAELFAQAHVDMQAVLQPLVDNSISKTINVPENYPFSEFRRIYDLAYERGLKRCTTFRPNPVTGIVLSQEADGSEAPHCCAIDREPD